MQFFAAQNAGDLIYVPANWKHMTLNIGESIGVGGQAVYGGEVTKKTPLGCMNYCNEWYLVCALIPVLYVGIVWWLLLLL